MQHSRLGDPLHLGLAGLVTEAFREVWKAILECQLLDPQNQNGKLDSYDGGGQVNFRHENCSKSLTGGEKVQERRISELHPQPDQ